jgi:hypothetical protein
MSSCPRKVVILSNTNHFILGHIASLVWNTNSGITYNPSTLYYLFLGQKHCPGHL